MIASSARTLLIVILIASESASPANLKTLSGEAQTAITKKLDQSSSTDLLVFNQDGSFLNKLNVGANKLKQYDGLKGLLDSHDSPVSKCKNPISTPPPGLRHV